MPSVSLSAAAERFLAWAELNLAPATVANYRLYLGRFIGFAGDVQADTLSPAMLRTWSRKFHPLQAVQRMVGWMHKEERSLAVNPLAGMRKIATGNRRRVLDAQQILALQRNASTAFRQFLLGMAETFARPQELRSVRPCDVRQLGGQMADADAIRSGRSWFELEGAKGFERRSESGRVRIIPISPRLGRLLLRLLARGVSLYQPFFRDSRGRPWTSNGLRCAMRRLRVKSDCGVDARGERVVCYTLRHTGATACAANGMRDWILAEVLGHASTRTTARYVHLQAVDVVDAMQRLWEVKSHGNAKKDRPGSPRTRSD